jgi:hypothetical protein
MTLRHCIYVQSHLKAAIEMAKEEPAMKSLLEGLEQALDSVVAIRKHEVKKTRAIVKGNVIELRRKPRA